VAPAPDDDRVSALTPVLLEVRIGDLADEDPHAEIVLVGAAVLAHRAALAAL
jgi:hypothetical protein